LASVEAFKGMRKYRAVLKSHRAAHACHYITWERQALKTVDGLDFFVEHLSAYERRLNLGKIQGKAGSTMKAATAESLSRRLGAYASFHFEAKAAMRNHLDPSLPDPHRIIGIIPYYGEVGVPNTLIWQLLAHCVVSASHLRVACSDGNCNNNQGMGTGQAQSSLSTRKAYIEATFWSIRALTSRVVIAVCTDADAIFIESLVETVFAPALKKRRADLGILATGGVATAAGFPVLTLLKVELQAPQSLPVAAVAFLVRTTNRESPPSHKWSYEDLPRRPGAGGTSIPAPVANWGQHLQAAAAEGGLSVWERVKHLMYTEVLPALDLQRGYCGRGGAQRRILLFSRQLSPLCTRFVHAFLAP